MYDRNNGGSKIQMNYKKKSTIELLENNVKDLQGQLAAANIRISELLDTIKEQQAQLSYYKNESL